MKALIASLTALSLLAADVTVTVDAPVGTVVTITVTVPPSTNVNKLLTRKAVIPGIPTPPMPVLMAREWRTNGIVVRPMKPLPGATNRSYPEHLDMVKDWGTRRRSE